MDNFAYIIFALLDLLFFYSKLDLIGVIGYILLFILSGKKIYIPFLIGISILILKFKIINSEYLILGILVILAFLITRKEEEIPSEPQFALPFGGIYE